MAITPWETGDTITAERLNGMIVEPLIVTQTIEGTVGTLNKTWKELKDCFVAGIPCYFDNTDQYGYHYNSLCEVYFSDFGDNTGQWTVTFISSNGTFTFSTTDSENGYPFAGYD